MMSEGGGDHESWDDEIMMNENNETPLPVVRRSSSKSINTKMTKIVEITRTIIPYEQLILRKHYVYFYIGLAPN